MTNLTELLESAGIKNNHAYGLHLHPQHDGSYQPRTVAGVIACADNNIYGSRTGDTYYIDPLGNTEGDEKPKSHFPKPEDYCDPRSPFYGKGNGGNGGDDQPPPSPPGIAILIDSEPRPVPDEGIELGWKELTK